MQSIICQVFMNYFLFILKKNAKKFGVTILKHLHLQPLFHRDNGEENVKEKSSKNICEFRKTIYFCIRFDKRKELMRKIRRNRGGKYL